MSGAAPPEDAVVREPFEAVIADTDGVLTHTAAVHERAWKTVFDELLAGYPGERPFSSADYRAHVDGKPRYDGVADFLASRGIELARGDPSDRSLRTVYGAGNRKNDVFLELLDRGGVEVFDDAVIALERWRRGDLKLAAVSSSRNCRRVLQAGGLDRRVDAIVDGELAARLELGGKRGILREAAKRLGIDPSRGVVLEDATSGVRAAREEGFGLVVGIARSGNEAELRDAGAQATADRLDRVRFPRRLARALERLEELSARRGARSLAIIASYEGALAHAEDGGQHDRTALPSAMRDALAALAARCPVAVVGACSRNDLLSRIPIPGVFLAGRDGRELGAGCAGASDGVVRRLLEYLAGGASPQAVFPVYLGSGARDEDAFAALEGCSAGVRVGGDVAASLAEYSVAPDEVEALLRQLAAL